ncbi:GTP-binding protein [Bacillus salacetis]|uniref:GTP-binding protein n=1 Tax=Bacillus salacetis TaxID=2315464 RepID=A0A3A1QQ30_9BACI|nr:GTP-binding protein [Bacillus salacetis]RIW28234.1 GTP-binding protein [Bacillus salacetis]
MITNEQYIQKTFYKTFLAENDNNHPIAVLGDSYLAEQQKDVYDLSFIRFAQGEVYFHHKDYEAAIFKWENINNELSGWAQKNTADAFFELDQFSTAEEVYKSVQTDCPSLKAEIALQLFSLYLKQGDLSSADAVIKNAVSMNPDYPDLTSIAQSFFEENMDWHSAVELAVNEAIRTEDLHWFGALKGYINAGVARDITPGYFMEGLYTLSAIDKVLFEQTAASLWESYRESDMYEEWIEKVNLLILEIEVKREERWLELPALYKETYEMLMDSRSLVKELAPIVPNLLMAWIKVTDSHHAALAASALLSWDEIFPKSIDGWAARKSRELISKAGSSTNGFSKVMGLLNEISEWTNHHDVTIDSRHQWITGELKNTKVHRLLVSGSSEEQVLSLINRAAGGNVLTELPSTPVLIKNDRRSEYKRISENGINAMESIEEFQEESMLLRQPGTVWLQQEQPAVFMEENRLAFMLASNVTGDHVLNMADSILYVIDGEQRLTESIFKGLVAVKEKTPDLKVNVLLSVKQGRVQEKTIAETKSLIGKYFPDADVFQAYSLDDLRAIARLHFKSPSESERTGKLLFFVKDILRDLLRQRVDRENNLIDSVQWNKDMEKKLNGAYLQLKDLEAEKGDAIKAAFTEKTTDVQNTILEDIPVLLRECAGFVKEDSDFRTLHLSLNDEMNKRIEAYLNDKAMPQLQRNLEEWIAFSKAELDNGRMYLEEMRDSFNAMYRHERLELQCDFKVLNDWRRDADRMTSKVLKDDLNILLRRNPSQVLLKSVGKIFGSIGQNKQLLLNQYTRFIESESYGDTAQAVMKRFMGQFQLFQQSIERDVAIFFRGPLAELEHTSEETKNLIADNEFELSTLKANPELVKDPLTIYMVKQRQLELMYRNNVHSELADVNA